MGDEKLDTPLPFYAEKTQVYRPSQAKHLQPATIHLNATEGPDVALYNSSYSLTRRLKYKKAISHLRIFTVSGNSRPDSPLSPEILNFGLALTPIRVPHGGDLNVA